MYSAALYGVQQWPNYFFLLILFVVVCLLKGKVKDRPGGERETRGCSL